MSDLKKTVRVKFWLVYEQSLILIYLELVVFNIHRGELKVSKAYLNIL